MGKYTHDYPIFPEPAKELLGRLRESRHPEIRIRADGVSTRWPWAHTGLVSSTSLSHRRAAHSSAGNYRPVVLPVKPVAACPGLYARASARRH